jgi:N-acetylglucosaminyldiphosphoundecaprenol N-acetyl-beta-D-mannosaminyltransferase
VALERGSSITMQTEDILGYRVAAVLLDACVEELVKGIVSAADSATSTPFWLACLNPHSAQIAMSDIVAEQALKAADILVPDGVGVVLASRILGGGIRKRITGSDIFRELSHRLNDKGGASYFFLGSSEETLARIRQRMAYDYPNIKVAGTFSPPFKDNFSAADNNIMIEAINKARPEILWVGMSAPKQEKWIYLNKDKLDLKFIGAVGAVFDFYAGNVKRSHPWFLKYGLEWLPRLLQEPKRLWQRTFISAPLFLLRVLRQRITD